METTVQKFNKHEDIEYYYFEKSIREDVYRLIIDYNK
jgi:hypothetical protein